MPWRTVTPMDEKLLFIADYLRGNQKNFTQLCRLYGISRKTGYKWVSRYEQQGMDGLDEQSRRPDKAHYAHPMQYARPLSNCGPVHAVRRVPRSCKRCW